MKRLFWLSLIGFALGAQEAPAPSPQRVPARVGQDEVIDRLIHNENTLKTKMASYRPTIETYLQELKDDVELGVVPKDDEYFLARLNTTKSRPTESFIGGKKKWYQGFGKEFSLEPKYSADGFSELIILNPDHFTRGNYEFQFLQREFLGEVRCLVFDMTPKQKKRGIFKGRIWVEDENYNIVRVNGRYQNPPMFYKFSHFDTWRVQLPNLDWVPAYVYAEDDERPTPVTKKARYKAQIRLWGYDPTHEGKRQEFTSLTVEPATPVRDNSEQGAKISTPVEGFRDWERQSEDNYLNRLQEAGLLAPEGEVDKVLCTVVNNLIVTNELDLPRPVRCRVLLTAPLESFNMGNTIVLSRGLIDVLPDEASLAMVLAYELAHLALGHSVDTKYAFADTIRIEDMEVLKRLPVRRSEKEIREADERAMQYLQKSPYKDKLQSAGLFLVSLANRSQSLPHLIQPSLGDRLAKSNAILRMQPLMQNAPELQPSRLDQTASLPLGARIYVDPWNGKVELLKGAAPRIYRVREKMPLEIAPVTVYLSRRNKPEPPRTQAAQ